jgi:two-component system sensor histidine kinase AlgZ
MKPAQPDEARQLYLPNFCSASAVLAIVLICELTALLVSLARNTSALGFWADLGLTSMFLLWIALCGAALLCLLRRYINSKSVAVGSALVLGVTVGLVIIFSWAAWYFGRPGESGWLSSGPMFTTDTWTFLLRNAGITFVVTALALRYFYVTHLWRHNVDLQARARVHALQARIRPHFLFNSMNTIAALTRSNPARAEEAVQDEHGGNEKQDELQ